jgi:hypothetical protein
MNVDDLTSLPRKDLQALVKEHGCCKGNAKTSIMIEALTKFFAENDNETATDAPMEIVAEDAVDEVDADEAVEEVTANEAVEEVTSDEAVEAVATEVLPLGPAPLDYELAAETPAEDELQEGEQWEEEQWEDDCIDNFASMSVHETEDCENSPAVDNNMKLKGMPTPKGKKTVFEDEGSAKTPKHKEIQHWNMEDYAARPILGETAC